MGKAGAIRAGKAFVELFADGTRFEKGLRDAERRLQTWGRGIARTGAGVFAAGASVAGPLALAVKAASDEQETYNKFLQVFGNNAQRADMFVSDLADSAGRSKTQLRDALSTLQAFFVGLGFTRDEAQGLSESLTALAVDFGSFFNVSDEESLRRFISALAGSPEVLDKFGVNTREAALKQEALRRGMDVNVETADEMTKALLRVGVIMRTMTDQGVVGDAVRTADQFANLWKRLRGEIRDTGAQIGKSLLPVLEPAVGALASGVEVVGEVVARFPGLVVGLGAAAALALAAGAAMTALGIGVFGVGSALGAAASAAGFLLSPLGAVVALSAAGAAAWLRWSGAGGAALDYLGGKASEAATTMDMAVGSIVDALRRGDVEAAAKVLAAALEVIFLDATVDIRAAWREMLAEIKKTAVLTANDLAKTGVSAEQAVDTAIADAKAGAQSVLSFVQRLVEQKDAVVGGVIAKGLVRGGRQGRRELAAVTAGATADAQTRFEERAKRIARGFGDAATAIEEGAKKTRATLDAASANAVDEYGRELRDRADAARKRRDDARKALDQALREEALASARGGKGPGDAGGAGGAGGVGGEPGLNLDALIQRYQQGGAGKGLDAFGSFGLYAGGRELPAQRTMDAIADNTKETAQRLQRLERYFERTGGAIFT